MSTPRVFFYGLIFVAKSMKERGSKWVVGTCPFATLQEYFPMQLKNLKPLEALVRKYPLLKRTVVKFQLMAAPLRSTN